jgi:ketosteroid isomerase-like protein
MTMRGRLAVPAVSLLFLLGFGCARPPDKDGASATGAAKVRERRQQWNLAFANHDAAALETFVEADAVHVSAQFTHVGRPEYLSVFVRALATRAQVQLTYSPDSVTACTTLNCAVVTEYGRWKETWLQEQQPTEVSGTYYAIWRQQNGEWRIRSEVFATTTCHGSIYCGQAAKSAR